MNHWLRRYALAKKDREIVKQGLSDMLGTGSDLMSNIIDSDRRRAGRTIDNSAAGSAKKGKENNTSSMVAQTTSSKIVKTTSNKQLTADDPMRQALLEMLKKPYSSEPQFTVTSVKIETEVLQRLGWVSTLTGEAKQDIVSSALKEYFQKVGR
jgi:hypothetical protein